jgi:hypothetical protein
MTQEQWARERALVELTPDDLKEIEPPKNGNGQSTKARADFGWVESGFPGRFG